MTLPEEVYEEILDAILAEAERLPPAVVQELLAKNQRRAS